MNKKGIVIGSKSPIKRTLASQMRKEMTEAESALWTHLRRSACGAHFRRQQIIDGFIADFYCHSAGLVIEVDGGVHDQQEAYDKLREDIITARGLSVLRFKNADVMNDMDGVLERIKAWLI
ncbi:MAG TPA: DUF559 domain-containing protein [Chthonomonadaceae bacterium]|nr:DUF559 domain-containing protein [Chthonomonadaceae bacterium]